MSETCDVDGCQKTAVAKLLHTSGEPNRCKTCLQYDLDL